MISHFQKFFQSASDLFCVIDRQAHFVEINQFWEASLGYTIDKIKAHPLITLVHPEDHVATLSAVHSAFETQVTTQFENRCLSVDGRCFDLQWRFSFDKESELLFAVVRNITIEKRQARLMEQTNSAALVGGWEVTLPDLQLYWTEETYRIHEIDPTDYIPEVNSAIDFYTLESQPHIRSAVDAALRDGTPFDIELDLCTAKGRIVHVRAIGRTEMAGDSVVRLFGAFQDISEQTAATEQLEHSRVVLEKSQQLFEAVVNSCPSIIFTKSAAELRYIVANRSFYELMAHRQDDILGCDDYAIFPTSTADSVREVDKRILEQRIPIESTQEVEVNGAKHTFLVNKFPLFNDHNEVYAIAGVATDITAQKDVEGALRKAKETAEEMNRLKRDFMANVSHEVRTPMNGIIGMTNLLLETPLSAEQKEMMLTVKTSAKSLLGVLNDILDFSKIEANKIDIHPHRFSLRALARDIVRLLHSRAQACQASMQIEIHDDIPDTLWADSDRLRQILINLINNALKFSPVKGVVTLTIKPIQIDSSDARMSFEVKDSGVGIPADKLKQIFDPFVQVDSSKTRRFGGAGLGLTISARLLELLGGKFHVVSEVGKGSSFSFELSLPVLSDQALGTTKAASGVYATPSQAAQLKILIAEDNIVNQKVAQKFLEKAGHSVAVVTNGEEALRILTNECFDILLLDLQMPILDGFETIYEIRRREKRSGKHLPVIALTAHAMYGDMERCMKAGMDSYITKPIDSTELISKVQDIFKKHTAVQEETT